MNPQKMYWHLLNNPPLLPGGERKRGSSPHDEYWRGYDGFHCLSAAGSIGWHAWRAGRDSGAAGRELRATQDRASELAWRNEHRPKGS